MSERDRQYNSETYLQMVKYLKLRIVGKPNWETERSNWMEITVKAQAWEAQINFP